MPATGRRNAFRTLQKERRTQSILQIFFVGSVASMGCGAPVPTCYRVVCGAGEVCQSDTGKCGPKILSGGGGSGGGGAAGTGGSTGATRDSGLPPCGIAGSVCTAGNECCHSATGTTTCLSGRCVEACTTNSDCTSACCIPLQGGGNACGAASLCSTTGTTGIGDLCSSGDQCVSGQCNGWCTASCASSASCDGKLTAGTNSSGQMNTCILTVSNTRLCAPNCASNNDCLKFAGATCKNLTNTFGGPAKVCWF